jgi:hypothetical protein
MRTTLRNLSSVALLVAALALSLGSVQAYAQGGDGNRIFEGVTIESAPIRPPTASAVLASERMQAGFHRVHLNGSELSSGVYVYRLVADSGEFTDIGCMVLVK